MNPDTGKADGGGRKAEAADQTIRTNGGSPATDGQPATTPTRQTKKEIHAAFVTVFGDVAKAQRDAERVTAAKRLKPYRGEVLKLRRAGLSWKKIAIGMRKPPIGVPVTPESLKAVFGKADGESRKAEGNRAASKPA
jgi:hypothetical protein